MPEKGKGSLHRFGGILVNVDYLHNLVVSLRLLNFIVIGLEKTSVDCEEHIVFL